MESKEDYCNPNQFNWDEPEQAPHKWYIESNLLHSDGMAYVGMYIRNSNSKRYGKQLYMLTQIYACTHDWQRDKSYDDNINFPI